MRTIIVRYGELALKSEPVRRKFEGALLRSIRLMLGRRFSLSRERGRIFVECRMADKMARKIAMLPGVTSTSPAISTSAMLEDIVKTVVRVARKSLGHGKSFAIRATRVGQHPFTSMDVCKNAGRAVLEKFPKTRVNLSSPDVVISVEVRGRQAYVYSETICGAGGLPTGTQGKVMALMKGKLRDAVAAYLMMKRGAVVVPLFVHRGTKSDKKIMKKVNKQVRRLQGMNPHLELSILKTGDDGNLAGAMERLARKLGIMALITGETIEEAAAVEMWGLQVLRPVAGLDGEIRPLARRAGLI
ncbi:MAG: THUMP domain-containing protein [Candidatus Hadarchaeales archaeon]